MNVADRRPEPEQQVLEERPEPADLTVQDLSLYFGDKQILREINLEIPAGQFIALIGPSGSGKSTLLNTFAGFITPATPGVTLFGQVLVGDSPPSSRSFRCGVVFQEYALFPWRTAQRNVEFALEALGTPAAGRGRRSMRYLQQVGLTKAAEQYPHQLSGGMKQRVAIARALAYEPSVLLMDEPLGALDAITREKLMGLIDRVWRETQTTVVYVTHNVAEAVFLADRVIVLKADPGEIILDMPVDLPRPRDQLSPQVIELEKRLRDAIPEMAADEEE
jgi:NitT/TauT family transport system ATP-binding protein